MHTQTYLAQYTEVGYVTRNADPCFLPLVDDILDTAFRQLNKRKHQTEDAVRSILYAEKWVSKSALYTMFLFIVIFACLTYIHSSSGDI